MTKPLGPEAQAVLKHFGEDLDREIARCCGRCGGTGYLLGFQHVDNGRCFECGGSGGHHTKTVRQILNNAKARDRRAAKRQAEIDKHHAEVLQWRADNSELIARANAINLDWLTHSMAIPSDKTIEAVEKIVGERELEAAERRPAPTGRVQVEGEVVSVKSYFSQYGESIKITVKSDEGFLVWGTAPSTILRDVGFDGELKGSRVRFTATVEPSEDDPSFGFYKRPTKAQLVQEETK